MFTRFSWRTCRQRKRFRHHGVRPFAAAAPLGSSPWRSCDDISNQIALSAFRHTRRHPFRSPRENWLCTTTAWRGASNLASSKHVTDENKRDNENGSFEAPSLSATSTDESGPTPSGTADIFARSNTRPSRRTDRGVAATAASTRDDSFSSLPPSAANLRARRLWKAPPNDDSTSLPHDDAPPSGGGGIVHPEHRPAVQSVWTHAVDCTSAEAELRPPSAEGNIPVAASDIPPPLADLLARVALQEKEGGRMKSRQLGVLAEDPTEDMRLLMHNYTVPALASALRDREEVLQHCAQLMADEDYGALAQILKPFEAHYVKMRRFKNKHLDLREGFDFAALEMLRRSLASMSRQITQAHQKRAGVVLPLCNVNGVACVLFEKRSRRLRAHPDEVCLPGGMVSVGDDKSITITCLREMEEEIGIKQDAVTVLGILRCNWGEVAQLTGVAVTPVVCFIGDVGEDDMLDSPNDSESSCSPSSSLAKTSSSSLSSNSAQDRKKVASHNTLSLNSDEVAECFTIPLESLMDKSRWIHRDDAAPIFTGGPYIIWGLTGYIVDQFVRDVLARNTVTTHSDVKSTKRS